jgi:hypothetical protein
MVDVHGNFKPIKGLTLICKLSPSAPQKIHSIEDFIEHSPVLRKYMKPLPSKSYHMTVFGIPFKFKVDAKQRSKLFVERPNEVWSLPLVERIEEISDNIVVTADVNVSVENVYIGESCGISFKVNDDIKLLRKRVSRKFSEDLENYIFHMTFAYIFKRVENEDIEDYSLQITNLKNYIYSIFEDDEHIKFLRPKIYSYDNMSDFKRVTNV